MAPSTLDLEFHKEEIISLFHSGHNADFIANHISQQLEIVNISERTIRRRLQQWGVFKRLRTQDSSQLRARITVLFYECLEDEEMLDALHREGYVLGDRALKRIRKDIGLSRRFSILEREKSNTRLMEIVQQELDKGTIEGYGRGYLHTYFRRHGYNFSRCVVIFECYIDCYIFTDLLFYNLEIGSLLLCES
jgi:hypothetical protein